MSSELPKRKAPAQRPSSGTQAPGTRPQRSAGSQSVPRRTVSSSGQGYRAPAGSRRQPPPPSRDPFPIVMGAIIGALVMGLVFVVFLLTTNNNQPTSTVPTNPGNTSGSVPTAATGAGGTIEPVRMDISEFKTLYDDPAKRPMIVDVRAKQSYDEGHITGSVNIPLVEADARISEFPKDKLILAYCQ